jgi:hypothetical protein
MALSCAGRRYLLINLTTRWQNSIGCSPDRPTEFGVSSVVPISLDAQWNLILPQLRLLFINRHTFLGDSYDFGIGDIELQTYFVPKNQYPMGLPCPRIVDNHTGADGLPPRSIDATLFVL